MGISNLTKENPVSAERPSRPTELRRSIDRVYHEIANFEDLVTELKGVPQHAPTVSKEAAEPSAIF